MKHFTIFRWLSLASLGVCLLAGCGGGGSSVPTPTTSPTALPNGCTTTTYSPNFYLDNDGDAVFTRWSAFPLRIYLPSTDATTRASTIAGFNDWVTATNGAVTYTIVSSQSNANISVSYSTRNASSSKLGITTVSYAQSNNVAIEAEIELFLFSPTSRADYARANQSIVAHEFGHALGIGTHSNDRGDLMYPSLQSAAESVTTRDLNTLKTIYCNSFPTRTTASAKPVGPTKKKVNVD